MFISASSSAFSAAAVFIWLPLRPACSLHFSSVWFGLFSLSFSLASLSRPTHKQFRFPNIFFRRHISHLPQPKHTPVGEDEELSVLLFLHSTNCVLLLVAAAKLFRLVFVLVSVFCLSVSLVGTGVCFSGFLSSLSSARSSLSALPPRVISSVQ